MAGRPEDKEVFDLVLYVAGQNPKSLAAIANLKRICEEATDINFHIVVVDLQENPQLAKGDQIVALPTLVRRLPPPVKKVIGDLSNDAKVLVGLNIRTHDEE